MNFLLIGKPNAGKSSLYNILTSGKNNIIHKEEGKLGIGIKAVLKI